MQAYLERRDQEWMDHYERRTAGAADAQQRVLAVFDAYLDHAGTAYEHGFRGCGLLNAAAELPAGSAGRHTVRQHKERVEALLLTHLQEITPEAAAWAEHLSFLLEGAVSRAGLDGSPARLTHAREIASRLLRQF